MASSPSHSGAGFSEEDPSTPVQRATITTDDDDIDVDFEPDTDISTTDFTTETEDADDEDYHDAEEEISASDLLELLAEDEEEAEAEEAATGGTATEQTQGQTQQQPAQAGQQPETIRARMARNALLRSIVQGGGLQNLLRSMGNGEGFRIRIEDADDDEEDEDYVPAQYGRRRRRPPIKGADFPKIPSDEGAALMASGNFGTNDRQQGNFERKKKLASRVMMRELGLSSPGRQRCLNKIAAQELIPSSNADMVIHNDHRCYSGQFSDDGNFFFACSQDFRVRMYDTSNPYEWKYYKNVNYPFGQWTITDASLSPDSRFLAYSSIRSMVCLAATDPSDNSEPYMLDFANQRRNRQGIHGFSAGHFGIWSVRFSGDGRELVAGTSDESVCAYDIETRQTVLHIKGHKDDVNAVCYGDKSSPHLLFSGSDDATIKVWDRRSMNEQRAAGVFLGHTEGLTYIDSKGDGRYVLSNGKDQTMKLWDLRKMVPTEKADRLDTTQWMLPFDYRFENYDTSRYYPHPHDCSVVTFRGHSVLKTLIRCHFSPPGSTDGRYVYSGSEDGNVYIWNMDATIAGKVNVRSATCNPAASSSTRARPLDFDDWDGNSGQGNWKTCVRDASWHPNAPMIAATSWNGYGMTHGTCSVHSWNDGLNTDEADPPMGRRVDPKLKFDPSLYEAPRPHALHMGRTRRAVNFWDDDD